MENLNYILHPHHISLAPPPRNFQTFLKSLADRVTSYHDDDRNPHNGGFAPQFNVIETETAFILDGELPGVGDKRNINVAWLQNQVLVIDGVATRPDAEKVTGHVQGYITNEADQVTEHDQMQLPTPGAAQTEATDKAPTTFSRRLLQECKSGPFHRSFTFPGKVREDFLTATLKDGMLRIVVPKAAHTAGYERKIDVM